MEKLRSKVFFILFLILTTCIFSFIIVFNLQKYIEEKNRVNNSLNVASTRERPDDINYDNNPPIKKDDTIYENVKFLDTVIYTVLIDNNDSIKEIINHSNNEIEVSKISNIAKNILSKNTKKEKHIGCLYFENYSYLYISNKSLTIIDNTMIKNSLLKSLELSFIIFILLETIVFLVSKKITNWIIMPVKNSFDRQKEFIADASHELKTPLSVIIASIEACEEDPKETKWLTNIKNESDRMNNLITGLLDLNATEHIETYKKEKLNLSKITELSILTFEAKTYENNIKLDYNIDENINMNIDENSIKELIEILLDNAVKHSKEKGTIKVTLKDKSNEVELLVENEGDPIPKSEENKIFERFYRIDKSRNRNSNRYGLGLAIAKNIVINHNGTITAYSKEGITTFKVLLKK